MFREVWFDYDQANIRSDEMYKVSEVVTHLQQNPSIRLGLDTFNDPSVTDPYSQALRQRRLEAVRGALINAGLPPDKIQMSNLEQTKYACGERRAEQSDVCRRVGMLIRTEN